MPWPRLVALVGGCCALFLLLCRSIPQVAPAPPAPARGAADTPAELVAAGAAIFQGDRAQCLTCHSLEEDPKARCPNQAGLGARAGTRQPGVSAARYLVEALYNPDRFVVEGYPARQMNPVNLPPIGLDHDEILAVIAYLNSLGGTTDAEFVAAVRREQEPWRRGLLQPDARDQGPPLPVFAGDAARGAAVYERLGCALCHRIGDAGAATCPDLTAIGAAQGAPYLVQSLVDPNAVIVKGYRSTRVTWQDGTREPLIGRVVEWIPARDHPTRIRLAEPQGEQVIEHDIDLAEVAAIGDAVAVPTPDAGGGVVCGMLVTGSAEEGVTLAVFEEGRWVDREFPAAGLRRLNLLQSPMPPDFAERVTARELYDLVAFLQEQKGPER